MTSKLAVGEPGRAFACRVAGSADSVRYPPRESARGSVSRVLSTQPKPRWATIPLGRRLRAASSDQPGRQAGTRPGAEAPCHPYSVLLPVGFTMPPPSPGARCALTAPFHFSRGRSRRWSALCGTVPNPGRGRGRRALPATVVPRSPDFPRVPEGTRGRPILWRRPPTLLPAASARAARAGSSGIRHRSRRRSARGGTGAGTP